MIRMRGVKDRIHRIQQGERANVYAVVVIGHFKAGKHALYQHAFSASGFTDNADQFIEGIQMSLSNQTAHLRHADNAAGGKVGGIYQTVTRAFHKFSAFHNQIV